MSGPQPRHVWVSGERFDVDYLFDVQSGAVVKRLVLPGRGGITAGMGRRCGRSFVAVYVAPGGRELVVQVADRRLPVDGVTVAAHSSRFGGLISRLVITRPGGQPLRATQFTGASALLRRVDPAYDELDRLSTTSSPMSRTSSIRRLDANGCSSSRTPRPGRASNAPTRASPALLAALDRPAPRLMLRVGRPLDQDRVPRYVVVASRHPPRRAVRELSIDASDIRAASASPARLGLIGGELQTREHMATGGKKKTTMAKLNRESRLRERRLDKQARKDARKRAAALDAQSAQTGPSDAEQPHLEAGIRGRADG